MERKALKLALEALETKGEHHPRVYQAIAAIKTALAQPAQEPVGSLSVRHFRGSKAMTNTDFDYTGDLPEGDYELYTAPPQRTWVGLTNKEAEDIWEAHQFNGRPSEVSFLNRMNLMQAIEAKLKQKNGY
jgi:hypothetical protein